MAPYSSILAWKIPWAEEPGGLRSMRLQELDMTELLSVDAHTSCILRCDCDQIREVTSHRHPGLALGQ